MLAVHAGKVGVSLVSFIVVLATIAGAGAVLVGVALVPGAVPAALGKFTAPLLREFLSNPGGELRVLIDTTTTNYATLATDIASVGGKVVYEYRQVSGLAAVVPGPGLLRLALSPEIINLDYDGLVTLNAGSAATQLPDVEHLTDMAISLDEPFQVLGTDLDSAGGIQPATYINTVTHGAQPLIDDGIKGEGTIVAIIDTGIYSGHFMLRGKVVGGVDVSADVGTGFEGFDDVRNHWHGSAVAGVLGGFAQVRISAEGLLARSIELHSGQALPDGPVAGTKILTLSGIAPSTKFFVAKVFPHTGAGAPTSTIVRAIDAAIEAKVSGRFDIDIISMSLGGATLFDGRGVDAEAIREAVSHKIAVSIAAGNEGPAPMTVADPGASNEAITSAALAHPINTRVAWDLQFGMLGIGESLFVGSDPQIIYFSNRGPTADGRAKPDVAAIGVFTLAPFPQTTNQGQGLAFVSGTSFSTPATSGVISLLNDFIERVDGKPDGATPEDYKRAILAGAMPIPGYSEEEQGKGFVNAAKALNALKKARLGTVASSLSQIPQGTPLERLADIRNLFKREKPTKAVRSFTTDVTLDAGENMEFVFRTVVGTDSIKVSLTNVQVRANPDPAAQTAFPNSFEVYIHDAKRGGSGDGFGYYIYSANVLGDATFTVREGRTMVQGAVSMFPEDIVHSVIEPGFSKVVVEGDWTNAVPVSARLTIEVTFATPPSPDAVVRGSIGQFNFQTRTGLVVAGPLNLDRGDVLKLFWSPGDYAHFPTSDLDFLIAKGPTFSSIVNAQGASLNAPERAILGNSGKFFVLILGFEVNPPGATETFELQIFSG